MTRSIHILLISLCSLTQVTAGFRAGVATRTVNPEPLLPVSGGVGPSHPATQQQGDLTVRAFILDDGEIRIAIVSADFLGFPAPLAQKVRLAVKSIPPENIMIGATHTHSAPDCYGFPDQQGRSTANPKYLENVCVRMSEAINEATENLRAARLKIATSEAKGKIAYNYYAEQLYDPRCHVIQAIDEADRPIATLVNYAIHPEVIGSEQGICSPDLVGPLYERLHEKGGGTGVFMNSAQGGMVTADNRASGGGETRTYDECKRIGYLLADEALRIIGGAQVQESPRIYCAMQRVTFPVTSPLMRALVKQLPGYEANPGDKISTQMNLVNIGTAQVLTIPGEALPNLGYYLKRKMRGEHNLLFGLTNDAFGYILTKEDFESFKRYEYITRTSLGENTGEVLESEALKMVAEAPAPWKAANTR